MALKPSEEKVWSHYWTEDLPAGETLPTPEECECTALDYLKKKNKKNMGGTMLRYFGKKVSYGQFFEKVQEVANAYYKLGVRKGDIITLVSVMTPETIYSFYAMDLLGATLNLADPRTSASGLHGYIEECKSKVVVCLNIAYPKIKKAVKDTPCEHVVVVSPADSLGHLKKMGYKLGNPDKNAYAGNVILWPAFVALAKNADDVKPPKYDVNRPLFIVHTGGTTGKPKGVELSDKCINAVAIQTAQKRGKIGDKYLNIMPPFIAYGFGVGVHTPAVVGTEIILIPQFDPNKFGALLMRYKPQHMAGVPLHYQILAADPTMKNADLSFIRTPAAGGDGITPAAEKVVNEYLLSHKSPYKICKGYGMTEVGACATACVRDINKLGSVGIPMCMTTVGIFDQETGEELGYNEEGEVCVCSPTRMLGYYEMPEETALVVRKHSDGKEWVHTGDIGKIDEDGFVFIVNRIKRVIIRHDGFKVFPYIIENAIATVPSVEACCAVGVKDPDHKQGKLPVVYIKAKPGVDLKNLEKTVRAVSERELPEYVLPAGYVFIDEMPYTAIGKVDYLSFEEKAKAIELKPEEERS